MASPATPPHSCPLSWGARDRGQQRRNQSRARVCRASRGAQSTVEAGPPACPTPPRPPTAPGAAGHGLSHLSVRQHTRHCWHCCPPSGGWAGPQPPPCPASASWERWASRTAAPHPGSPAGCAAGGGRTLSRPPRANKEAGGQQEAASGAQARSSKGAGWGSWARRRALTHLQGVGRRGDVAEQVGEEGLSGGAPLQHPGRGPTHLNPQLQHGIHLGPHGAVAGRGGEESSP